MKQFLIVLSLYVAVAFSSCKSGKEKDVATDNNRVNDTSSDAERMTRWEERKAKGDTMALPYKDLQVYFPDVAGYARDGAPKGSDVNSPGMGSWSESSEEYVNGDKRVSLKITDYNGAWQTFQGMTAIYGMGFKTEDDTKKYEHADLGMKHIYAYQVTYKTEKKSELVVIVNDRFMINLDSEGENDGRFLRDIAKHMK